MTKQPEVWLRGPVAGVDPVLQPVAHALLQVAEDVPAMLEGLTPDQLWARPGGSAPIGFHLAHLTGSLDRLLAYARGEALSPAARAALEAERAIVATRPELAQMLAAFHQTLEAALAQLRATKPESLLTPREVGRARLPSTVLGLLFHAAEHTARHAGQIATLVKVVRG